MSTRRIKKSFTAGELDPLLGARVDFGKYKDGCRALYNMVCLSSGSATRRPGLEFMDDLHASAHPPLDDEAEAVMIPFVVNSRSSVQLALYRATDNEIYLLSALGDTVTYFAVSTSIAGYTGPDFTLDNLDYAQYGYRIYVAQTGVPPFYLQYNTVTFTWSAVKIAFSNPITDWSDANGWPETVTFHQERSYWGGSVLRPQAIWASAIGEPHNMGVHSSVPGVADGFSFQLESNIWDTVAWMYPDKVLNVGTLGQEWVCTGLGGSGPMTGVVAGSNTGVDAVIQTSIGSMDINPIKIGGSINFIGQYGRNIYDFQYSFANDNYLASDKSILAQHLTFRNSITSWAYQRIPNGILWASTELGQLLGCTLIPEHKIAGWHRHSTNGSVLNVCTVPKYTAKQDAVWALVARSSDNGVRTYLERMSVDWVEPDENGVEYYLDSYKQYSSPGGTVTGLDHLKGREVSIWADGMTLQNETVDSSGEIELDQDDYVDVIVGFNYMSEVRPYLGDINTDKGSSFGQMQAVVSLAIDFYNTRGGEIGVSYQEENGTETETTEDLQFRTSATSMSSRIPLYTGIYNFTFQEGNDRKSEYFIRQRYPQPMTVRGVVDTVEVE